MKVIFWSLAMCSCLCLAIGIPMILHYMCGMTIGMSVVITVFAYILCLASLVLCMYFEDMYYNKRKNGVDKGKKM